MWGIVPAAGRGSRIKPLAFSKELLPRMRSRRGTIQAPPRCERLSHGTPGGRRCFQNLCRNLVGKVRHNRILRRLQIYSASLCYVVQEEPKGLCDAIFRTLPVIDPAEPGT